MNQVKVTDKASPLFGKVGMMMSKCNEDHYAVSIDGKAYNLHRLSFKPMNVYRPRIINDEMKRLIIEIEKVREEIARDVDECSQYSTTYADGGEQYSRKHLQLIDKLLSGNWS